MIKKIIYVIVAIIVAVGSFLIWQRASRQEVVSDVEKKVSPRLTYIRSINDDKTMALDGTHEFWPKGNYLYVTSIKDNGLNVFDVTDPANPKFISAFVNNDKTLMKRGHSVMFFENYAFVSATGDNAIQVFDITDPTKILPLGPIRDKGEKSCLKGVHGIGVKGNYLYAAGTGDNALCFYDITDPKNIENIIGEAIYDTNKLALKGPHSIYFVENYLYVLGEEGLQVFDIAKQDEPKSVFSTSEGVKGGHDIKQKGNYLYTTAYIDGLGVFDVTDPKEPKRIAGIAPNEENGLYYASDSDIINNSLFIVSEKTNSLIMVDISNPSNPVVKELLRFNEETTPFLYNGHTIRAIGNYLYVAGLQNGFGIVKFSE